MSEDLGKLILQEGVREQEKSISDMTDEELKDYATEASNYVDRLGALRRQGFPREEEERRWGEIWHQIVVEMRKRGMPRASKESVKAVPGKGEEKKMGDKKIQEKKIFLPIEISILEQGDKEDEYFELAKHSSVRSEGHLVTAIRRAVRAGMEEINRPFDAVDIVFRRTPIAEEKRHKAERELLALFHQYEDGTVGTDRIGKKAEEAVKLGVKLEEVKKHTEDEDIRKALDEAIKIASAGARVDEFIGQRVILELMGGGRHLGTISKGPWGPQSYQIKTDKGTFKFSMNDVERVLAKTGGAQE